MNETSWETARLRCRSVTLLLALALVFVALPAAAFEVLVCYPGGSVRARDAKPALADMVKVIESVGGWAPGSISTTFTTRTAECRKLLDEKRPPFAILSLGLFLEARRSHHLVPLVQPRVGGQTNDRLYLLVRQGTYQNLEQLRGKSLGGPWLEEQEFLKRVVFAGKLDPERHFKLKPSRRVLRALRQLDRGRLDAVLVNRPQYEGLAALPFGKNLKAVFESQPLPQIGVVADSQRAAAAERQRMVKALKGMCAHPDGKKLCELFGIDDFVDPDARIIDAIIKAWEQGN